MTAKVAHTLLIGLQDGMVRFLCVDLHPRQQSRPEVETDFRIVVYDILNNAVGIQDPRRRIGSVAFGRYALIPIVIRVCRILDFDYLQPGILPRGLIKVTVYTYVFFTKDCHASF